MSDVTFVLGTICKSDPELKVLPSGKSVCNFSIRVPGQKANEKYGREKREPEFLEVAAWDQLGENAAESFCKGDRVILQGLRGERTYKTQAGEERTVQTFTAWDAALSVLYNTAEAVVVEREGPEDRAKEASGLQDF